MIEIDHHSLRFLARNLFIRKFLHLQKIFLILQGNALILTSPDAILSDSPKRSQRFFLGIFSYRKYSS